MTLIKFREMQMRDACPEGVISCECNDAPGTNVTDNFFLEDGIVNAMITHAGCNPGMTRRLDFVNKILFQRHLHILSFPIRPMHMQG